ncbi:MAG TPA: hypothetical protein VF469_20260 [Kofleriaceae bacterium]
MPQTTPSGAGPGTTPSATAAAVTPNLFHLAGPSLHLTYSTSSITGQPILIYQDAHQTKSFRGQEINTIEDTELGTIVSVVLHATPDVGSTTFSLLVPRIQVSGLGAIAPVRTYGITTMHSSPLAGPGTALGQLDTYTVTQLHGTAQAVVF